MRIVSKGDDLWVDQDSIPMQDLEWVTSIYGAEPKRTEILCTAKNGAHGTNVVTKNAVREMLEVNPLNPLPTSTLSLGPSTGVRCLLATATTYDHGKRQAGRRLWHVLFTISRLSLSECPGWCYPTGRCTYLPSVIRC